MNKNWGGGGGDINLVAALPCKYKHKQQRPIKKNKRKKKKNKTCLLSAYYTPGPVLNTKYELSPGIIKATLAQMSYDYHFTDGTLRLGVNTWGSSGLSRHIPPQLGSLWARWRTLKKTIIIYKSCYLVRDGSGVGIQSQQILTTL